jgi:hypothetical protein
MKQDAALSQHSSTFGCASAFDYLSARIPRDQSELRIGHSIIAFRDAETRLRHMPYLYMKS